MAHEHDYAHEQERDHIHESVQEREQDREHPHAHPGGYAHFHSPEEKKRQLNRLSRVIGHLQHVKKMIEADEDCADVLTQLSATRSALTGLGKEIMNEHVRHCISHALEDGDTAAVEEFQKAIEKFF